MKRTKKEPAPPAPPKTPLPAAADPDGLDLPLVRSLAGVLEEFGLSELRVSLGKKRIVLRKQQAGASPPQVVHMPAPAPAVHASPAPAASAAPAPAAVSNVHVVTSPFVGTFYRSPSPESAAFVEVGDRVKKGQTLCIVEAMKLMNEIESEVEGIVLACLVENAQPVEFGQALYRIQVG
jgi:acetyl-CoA carboxylase biotin carboxyl carrier protein